MSLFSKFFAQVLCLVSLCNSVERAQFEAAFSSVTGETVSNKNVLHVHEEEKSSAECLLKTVYFVFQGKHVLLFKSLFYCTCLEMLVSSLAFFKKEQEPFF